MFPDLDITFWNSFWPSLFSSLISTFIIAGLIGTLLYLYRKPKLSLRIDVWSSVSKDRTLIFKLKNEGKISLMASEAQWCIYISSVCFESKSKNNIHTTTDKGSFYEFTGFNDAPCHPGATSEIFKIDVRITDSYPYKLLDEAPFYCTIYTNKGCWKPRLFSKARKDVLCHRGENPNKAYRIEEICI
ncbi:MAG: hypothetical protein ACI9CO_000105 [Candidatus Azotimanducaceae bacterium]|jgi:hypothetical protein